jgi:hypothetical protein
MGARSVVAPGRNEAVLSDLKRRFGDRLRSGTARWRRGLRQRGDEASRKAPRSGRTAHAFLSESISSQQLEPVVGVRKSWSASEYNGNKYDDTLEVAASVSLRTPSGHCRAGGHARKRPRATLCQPARRRP